MTTTEGWRPSLGAWPEDDGVRFRVWAPAARQVTLRIEGHEAGERPMEPDAEGYHQAFVQGLGPGARYRYLLDGEGPFPDPASRYQPEGVHGPSEVVDPTFDWTDEAWGGLEPDATVLYELHVGTFTEEGTFAAAAEVLPRLAELGVTAVQVMPVADFAGDRNWGYDGVALFAPSRTYGRPEDFRRFVDRAHALGLGVVLDVVYNHFGPDGAYHSRFSPRYFNDEHHTPWGAAINLDAPGSEHVRGFFFEQALHWLREYHVDGFRLDAVHTLIDEGEPHFLAEFRDRTSEGLRAGQPPPFLLAEEHRNLAVVTRARAAGGYGFDAQYADDFHHEVHVILTGDREGYYRDFRGATADLAVDLRQGWLFMGQRSKHQEQARGTDPEGQPLPRFMHCLQNHDQVGNRAFGDRLYHEASAHGFRAATAVLLFSAATPLLFMGDEWGATSQFLYFTDHKPDLGRLVTEGRRGEFAGWRAFSDPRVRERIPDPQDPETFRRSRLDWAEREREPHASTLRLYQALLRLRREEPALRRGEGVRQDSGAPDADTIAVRREREDQTLLLVARLRGAGATGEGAEELLAPPAGSTWEPILTTEDAPFVLDPLPVDLDVGTPTPTLPRNGGGGGSSAQPGGGTEFWCHFRRPGAVVLRAVPAGGVPRDGT